MPSPTARLASGTPSRAASALRSSSISGSPYCHTEGAASRMAWMTRGEGPKLLSLAPTRARMRMPLRRSSVSGATKGTVSGSACAMLVSGGMDIDDGPLATRHAAVAENDILPRRLTSVPCGRRSTGLLASWQIVAIVRDLDAGGVQPELCLFPEVDIGLPPFRALDPAAQAQHHRAIRQGVDEDHGLRIGQHALVAGNFQQRRAGGGDVGSIG